MSEEAQAKIARLKENYEENLKYVMATPLPEQQEDWEKSASFYQQPDFMKTKVFNLANITAERISWRDESKNADKQLIFYFHGGGLTLGSTITHRKLGTLISMHSKVPVLIHNYPLAPTHPFPEGLNASVYFYEELLKKRKLPETIIFGGDSSGAGLAVSTILQLKKLAIPLPKGLFLLSPHLDNTFSGATMSSNAKKDFTVYKEDLALTGKRYYGNEDAKNPLISPIYGDLRQFPPTFIQAGSHEILLSDAVDFAEKLKQAKVPVELDIWEEMWHVFQSDALEIPEAEEAMKNLARFIRQI